MEAADSKGDARLHLQVKNTFIDVQIEEDYWQRRTPHTRSKSWDGSTSSSSVCSATNDSEIEHYYGANGQSRQELHHWVVQTNSSASASVTDSAGETAGQSFRDFVWELENLESGRGSPEQPVEAPMPESDGDDDFQPEFGQSIGSKGHGRGKCTPCTRILVRPGCEYGSRCMFCHLEHSNQTDNKKNRHRPCKAARQQYKQTIQKIYEEYKDKPEQKQKALGKIADASPYMRSLLKGLDGKEEEEVMEEPKKSKAAAAASAAAEMPRVPGLQPAGASSSSSSVVKDRKTLISL